METPGRVRRARTRARTGDPRELRHPDRTRGHSAEVDRLARALLLDAERLSIVATRRHEYGEGSETVVHQVTVQVTDVGDTTTERLRAGCEVWAVDCAADRHLESLDV